MAVPLWFDGALQPGQAIALSPSDPALIYGATVFTTLRIYGGDLDHPATAWAAHCDRLRQAVAELPWAVPDWSQLRQGALALQTQVPPEHVILRITLFPDGRELLTTRPLPPELATLQRQGIRAWVAPVTYQRPLPQYKTGNYLPCWLALQAAKAQDAQEAILVNSAGEWLETSTGNLWGWAAGQWHTPPLATGILPGVLRSRLLIGLAQQGHTVVESPWDPVLRQRFTHLAYSNSAVEIIPIQQVLLSPQSVDYNPDHEPLRALWQALQASPPEF